MWHQSYIDYGVLDVFDDEVKVHKDRWQHVRIICPKPITRAYWSGRFLVISMRDGAIRRYHDQFSYETIR